MSATDTETRQGFALGFGAYMLWGVFPVYWKLLEHVPSFEILAHRMTWSLVFVVVLVVARGTFRTVSDALTDRKTVLVYGSAAALLAVNWGTYIWGVNAGYIVETSLGYFINPLLNVAFGALLLGERLRRGQWIAIGLAGVGVVYLTVMLGRLPWIALVLAFSFATYSVIKKKAALGAIEGLTVETTLMVPLAGGYLVWLMVTAQAHLFTDGVQTDVLLLCSGIATGLPLILFAGAVKRLTLTTIGLLQYFAPTIQFLLGVLVYGEPMEATRLMGFAFIWTGLMVFSVEGILTARRRS